MAQNWPRQLRDARALLRLRAQVDALAPARNKSSDGIRASKQHSAVNPNSDHEPHVMDGNVGVFTAIDISHDPHHGVDSYKLADHLRSVGNAGNEKRIKYIISNRRIWNPSVSANWRPYHGSNPHNMHVHISLKAVKALYDDEHDWDVGSIGSAVPDAPPVAPAPKLRHGSNGAAVSELQRLLHMPVNGQFDTATEHAVRAFQSQFGLEVDGIVGPYTWRALRDHPPAPQPQPVAPPQQLETGEAWQTNIIATIFSGERGAYGPLGHNALYVALPFKFQGPRRKVKCRNRATGKTVICPIEDIGPWLIDDPYWVTRTRPLAEISHDTHTRLPRGPNKGRYANGAGIDLSPAAARAIGITGLGKVDWTFV